MSRLTAEGEIATSLGAYRSNLHDYDITPLREQIDKYRAPKRKNPLTEQQRELERARKRRYYQAHRMELLQRDRDKYARLKNEYPHKYEERLTQIREYKRKKRMENHNE